MKKIALFSSLIILIANGFTAVTAQEELIYVAVEPCRIADTRKSAMGVIRADTSRNFLVAGKSADLASQGGTADCLNPKGDVRPVAISAYILAVPANSSTRNGVLTAYPSDQDIPPPGTGSTVNFDEDQVIGNTTTVKICVDGTSCPSGGELAILARNTDEHVVVDVQGYFYPQTVLPGYVIARASFATANNDSLRAEAICPDQKKVLGGGGSLNASSWVLDSSNPRTDGRGWQVVYKSTGATFSASGFVWAVCASVN